MSPRTIQEILAAAGICFRGGRWLRLRGADLDAISVNAASGAWKDHRSGDHGNFHALCQKLGIDHGGIHIDSAAIHGATTQQEKAARKSMQWAKTVWNRGIPAVQPKRPAGWAQEAWDADQSQYSDHRETIYDYLSSRGLYPIQFMHLIRIQHELNPRYKDGKPDNVDAEMEDAGADFAFLMPMYTIGKAEIPENICGIQRTFLSFPIDYQPVKKIGRAMLGRKGITTLSPTGKPVLLPESGPVIGSGEGFENVAPFVQIMRRPGAVCWDWSGLKAWSESLAPREDSPTIAFLVDSDKSETGQRESAAAVRRIMAHEHGKAVYLLPPESIQPDDKGNRDWSDLLRQSPDYFAAEIVHAWHKSDENLALTPASNDTPAITRGPKDAEIAQAIAEAVERNIAFQRAESAVRDYMPKYKEHIEKIRDWKNIPEEERKEKKLKKPKLPPLLVKVTTGVGKSHLIREIVQAFKDVPLLILTRTHDLAEEYAKVGAFHYHGRSMPDAPPMHKNGYTIFDLLEKGAIFKTSDCFKYPIVELVAAKNHAPSTTACRECTYGKKYILETYHEESEPFKKANEWFLSNSIIADSVPACPWLYHQSDAARAKVVVAPYASYSDTLAQYRTPERTLERLVLVDEVPDLTRQIRATSDDMGVYAQKCVDEVSYLSCHTQTGKKDAEELANLIADNQSALYLFQRAGAWLGSSVGKKGMQNIPDEMRRLVNELHIDWLPGATARWEKAELRYGYDPFVPLRIMKGLVESISTRTAIVDAGAIHVHEITSLGDRITKGLPTILLDATPSPAVEFLVRRKGGQVVDAIAKQHVRIVHFNQYLHGCTWKNKDHQKQELSNLLDLRGRMIAETGNVPVVLTYMAHCELADKTEDGEWGYFGRDDVGQDNWKSRDMQIFGGQIFSPTTQAMSYNSQLLLKRLAGDESSPDWSADVRWGVEVTVGNKVITSMAPLPPDPVLRAWVLDDYARRMVQCIGRARAVWATDDKPINIWIAGGLPLAGLPAYGLEVSEYRKERKNMNDAKSQATQERVQVAVAALQAADKDTSYRKVNAWFERNGKPGVRYDAWKKIMQQSVYDPDKDTYEVVDALLKSLQTVVDSAKICGCDPTDIARDRIAAGDSLPPVQRIAAALVIEVCPRYAGDWPNPEHAPS
jgi:hypothetical protein